jgi:hypothetical protein
VPWTSCRPNARASSRRDELELLRDLGEAVRRHALANLPQLLQQLESNLQANGVQVHWAETAEEANAIIHGIAERRSARRIIKGKSMASEEVELNHYLAERGIECVESDMGEYIVQLAEKSLRTSSCPPCTKPRLTSAPVRAAHSRHELHGRCGYADPGRPPRLRQALSMRISACPA